MSDAAARDEEPHERGPALHSFEASSSDQRAMAHLRTASALLVGAGALAMLLGRLSFPMFLFVLVALVIALAWLGQARRLRKAARQPPELLTVYAGGFARRGPGRDDWLAFRDVERIEIDEERLEIVVTKRDGSSLRMEPCYAGVDIQQLVHTLDNARAAAQSASGHVDSAQQAGSPGWRA